MHTPAQLNTALAGRYEIERELGQGGMATVFLARDLKHHRSVALKVLSSELAAVVGRERFLAEIEVTANLHHPHLLPLFDSGEIDGLLFYVMPYVEGESLRARLARERQLTIDDAVHIAAATASALDYAHRHGVIHRDLKPENILMHERDPLVMDFGIALAVSNAGGARVTQAGISLGTPQYMSPEQATGDRQLDARSDIYSLGAVTYEMIAGEPPHTGSSLQAIMAKVVADRPKSLHELRETVPEHVEAAVMRALAKLPADRFVTAADFADAITGVKALALTSGRQVPAMAGAVRQLPVTPEPQPLVRRRTLAFAAVGVVLAALGGAIGARAMHRPEPEPEARFVIPLPDSVEFTDTEYRQAALSKDGTRAVLDFTATYPNLLYTRRIGEMHLDPIIGTDSGRGMVIAPNGKDMLYWVAANAGVTPPVRLMRIPIEGGVPVKIADSATGMSQATWGDNNQVIFRRDDHLVLVSADAGPERVLARPDTTKGQYGLGWPEMLPGSRSALITILHGRAPMPDSLYLGTVKIADGTVTDLGVRGLTPHFAQGHVLYVRTDGELFARPFDVNKGRFTGEPRAIAKDVSVRGSHGADFNRGFTDMSVSETGMILFTDGGPYQLGGGGGGTRWSIVRRAGTRQVPEALQVPQLPYKEMRASPDGSMLALAIQDTANASRQDIFVYTFATGQFRQLTRNGKSSTPVWSPDGKRIIYRVTDPAAKPIRRFFSVPLDESEAAKPFPGADGAEAVELPGPEGKYIAYVRGDSGVTDSPSTNSDIFIAPIDSPTFARPFAAMGIRERMPRFSPNGKWLAYVGHEIPSTSGGAQTAPGIVYMRPVPGPGAVVKVSLEGGTHPLWSHDGRTLYYFAGGGSSPFTAAHISESPDFKVTATDIAFERRGPGTGFGQPVAPWTTDILPNGDVVYLTTGTPPVVAATGPVQAGRGTGASAPVVAAGYSPKLVAIVNWLNAESSAKAPR